MCVFSAVFFKFWRGLVCLRELWREMVSSCGVLNGLLKILMWNATCYAVMFDLAFDLMMKDGDL
jgi:hypothetical protein